MQETQKLPGDAAGVAAIGCCVTCASKPSASQRVPWYSRVFLISVVNVARLTRQARPNGGDLGAAPLPNPVSGACFEALTVERVVEFY